MGSAPNAGPGGLIGAAAVGLDEVFVVGHRRDVLEEATLAAGAHEKQAPLRKLTHRGPQLLAVDDVVIARQLGARAQTSEVRSRARLGKALAPDFAVEDTGDVLRLLFGRASLEQDAGGVIGRNERQDQPRRIGARQFLADYLLLGQAAPAAGPVLWPVRDRPATRDEFAEPFPLERQSDGAWAASHARKSRRKESSGSVLAEGRHHRGAPPQGASRTISDRRSDQATTSIIPSTARTVNVAVGQGAGAPSASPVARSKRAPCVGHMIQTLRIRLQASGMSAWLHLFSTA